MTDALRYDILKKDGFRCRLCGQPLKRVRNCILTILSPFQREGKQLPKIYEHCAIDAIWVKAIKLKKLNLAFRRELVLSVSVPIGTGYTKPPQSYSTEGVLW